MENHVASSRPVGLYAQALNGEGEEIALSRPLLLVEAEFYPGENIPDAPVSGALVPPIWISDNEPVQSSLRLMNPQGRAMSSLTHHIRYRQSKRILGLLRKLKSHFPPMKGG